MSSLSAEKKCLINGVEMVVTRILIIWFIFIDKSLNI